MALPPVRPAALITFLGLTWAAVVSQASGTPPVAFLTALPKITERTVFLAGEMEPCYLLPLSVAVAGSRQRPMLLIDSPGVAQANRAFLDAFKPDQIIPVGSFPGASALGLSPGSSGVVVCPAEPRCRLLQAACLAGANQFPLLVFRDKADEATFLELLKGKKGLQVFAIGEASQACRGLTGATLTELTDEESVAAAHRQCLQRQGPIESLVVANPDDAVQDRGAMSLLAPWIAVQRRAALVLTNKYGDNVEPAVNAALKDRNLKRVENLILCATLKGIPMERRPNPLPDGRDAFIEMEPFTPSDFAPYTFSIGRVFHDDPAFVAVALARQRLFVDLPPNTKFKALVASNSGGGLSLLETFSRNTAQELRNCGYETTSLFGKKVTQDELRHLLPQHHLFLWEGHHNTLIRDWMFADWTEPLPPALMFLQSCLALSEWKAQPLIERGAVAVVGSSTRVFSGSGGACSLAFFDAMLYDDQTLGGALRQAKNFLVCYGILKEKRLGADSRGGGPTLRSAWAFTLWGDPTLKLPKPEPPADALPAVRHHLKGNTLTLELPKESQHRVITSRYQAQMFPNGRLGGLLRKDGHEDEGQPLVPFVFAEVHFPKAPAGKEPHLKGRLPSNCYVLTWDARRATGYLLAAPRSKDQDELRFTVEWRDE